MSENVLTSNSSVVLDTCVLVAGLRSFDGASNKILQLVANQSIVPFVTTALFLEYEDVLSRDTFLEATGFTLHDVDRFLAAFASAARPVDVHFRWRPQLRDPKDELVLECAVNAGDLPLITHNIRDFSDAAKRFSVPVMTPGKFLKRSFQ